MTLFSNPNGGLNQRVRILLDSNGGLMCVISGPWDLVDTVAELQRVVPYFDQSVALENGFAAHPDLGSAWVGLDGPMGSGVILFVDPREGRFMAAEVIPRFNNIEARWHCSMVTGGELAPAAADHLSGADAVPAAEFLGG